MKKLESVMNREIKYRVYDTVMNRYNRDQQFFLIDSNGVLWMDRDPKGADMSGCIKIYKAPKRWIYEFYTGLKDKREKEIYEGDIVLLKEWADRGDGEFDNVISKVTWTNSAWFVLPKGEFLAFVGDVEVIGNIHENPDLL